MDRRAWGDSGEAGEIVNKPAWAIMRNDRDCQSIALHNGLQMAAFFTAGSTGRTGEEITVDQPCLAMWSEGRIWMSDPSMEGRAVRVTSKAGQRSFTLPKGGKTETALLETQTR